MYELTVNGQTATLQEGEPVTFAMQPVKPKARPGIVTPKVEYPGNGGTITVTPSKGVYYWTVTAPCATGFRGTFSITDLTSGLSGGSVLTTKFSDSAPTSKLYNHRYTGTLSGQATNWLGVCATTAPNASIYQYEGN